MPRTPGKALADTRNAIRRKITAMIKQTSDTAAIEALLKLDRWITQMDERALTRKGGIVLPRRPLKKLGRKS